MISLLQNLILAILVGIFASGTPVEKRQTKYITQEFQDTRVRSIEKRDESIDVDDFHQRYVVHVKVGSSQQDIRAHIDTGSIRWEIPSVGSTCSGGRPCAPEVSFDPYKSTTFENLTIPSKSPFGHGKLRGFVVSDDIYFNDDQKVPQFEFDLLNTLQIDLRGILGAGYSTNTNSSYVLATKAAGLIDQAAFSIFKGTASSGTYLLGGVDKAKYEGNLYVVDSTGSFEVQSITTANGTVIPFGFKVTQDTGNPYMTLLDTVVQDIYKDVGADEKGHVLCDQVLNGNKSLTFRIGTFDIPVYYSDIFFNFSSTICGCGIGRTSNVDMQYVGLPFLRNTYFAQNFDTKKIGLAPIKYIDESDIVDFWF